MSYEYSSYTDQNCPTQFWVMIMIKNCHGDYEMRNRTKRFLSERFICLCMLQTLSLYCMHTVFADCMYCRRILQALSLYIVGTVFAKLCNVALCRPTVKVLCFLPVVVYFILFYLETLFLPGDFILTWGYYFYHIFFCDDILPYHFLLYVYMQWLLFYDVRFRECWAQLKHTYVAMNVPPFFIL